MGRVVGDLQEERFSGSLLDEANGLRGNEVGHVSLFLDGHRVLEEVALAVSSPRVGVEIDEAAQEAEKVVESVRVRAELWFVAQVPLPDESRSVAVVLQQLGQRVARRGKSLFERGPHAAERPLEPYALLVSSGDEGGTSWRAKGSRIEVRQLYAILREAIDVWRPDIRGSIAADVAVADIVRNNQNDIRPPLVACRTLCGRRDP